MLTDAAARKAVARERDYKMADANGLSLFVSAKGHKSWRYKYRFGGKERRIVFGAYPEVTLKAARDMRDEARAALRKGRDPGLENRRARLARRIGHEDTFERFAREWHELQKARWKPVHADDVITSMERDLFAEIGAFPIGDVDAPLLLAALRKVEARGSIETAHRLRQRAECVFKYAASEGSANQNPDVRASMKPVPPKKKWPAVVEVEQLRRLIREVDQAPASPITRLASRFLCLTAQRPGMVRNARWTDMEGIDWTVQDAPSPNALWRVPADRMKQELELREDQAFEHVVPLSASAVETLRTVWRLTGRSEIVFCGARGVRAVLSENAIGYLYNRTGWKGLHVPHGWRSSFSTIMNGRAERLYPGADRLVIDRLIVDLMLAHAPSGMSETELRYNRQAYMQRRCELAEAWAGLIMEGAAPAETLLAGARRRKAH